MLEVPLNKKERHKKLLYTCHNNQLDEEDYVWLSLEAQKLHVNHKDEEPIDDG